MSEVEDGMNSRIGADRYFVSVLTPHLGSATERARYDMADIAGLNILSGIAGEPMLAPIP